jgi:sarcosine oxidase subunit gamma
VGSVTLTEVTDRALASVAQRKGEDVSEGFKALGFDNTPGICAMLEANGKRAWWMGPDQWMIDAKFDASGAWATAVKDAMGTSASVTDQSEGFCRYDLSGDGCVDLLQRLCGLDVERMEPGSAQRTQLHHMGCVVIRTESGWTVLGAHSSAGSLHHALLEVAVGLA